jgi:hypothetical protein
MNRHEALPGVDAILAEWKERAEVAISAAGAVASGAALRDPMTKSEWSAINDRLAADLEVIESERGRRILACCMEHVWHEGSSCAAIALDFLRIYSLLLFATASLRESLRTYPNIVDDTPPGAKP